MSAYLSDLWRRRRRALGITVSVVGGAYLLGKYVKSRITEAQVRMMDEKAAQDNLKRRFKQNQEDCAFTIQALLPTLAHEVVQAMDVDACTEALQSLAQKKTQPNTTELSDSRMSSAFEEVTKSQADLSSSTVTPGQSYADVAAHSPPPAASVSDSVVEEKAESDAVHEPTKSKAELWAEIKLLSLARSITSLYLLTLLVLQTHLQLNLIGRYKYLGSIVDAVEKETTREKFGAVGRMTEGLESPEISKTFSQRGPFAGISSQTEVMYLTFSWWLLNMGWVDVAERVQDAVKQVFESISLKTSLTPTELSKKMREVRALVEGEGNGVKHNFSSALLPSNANEEAEVLQQAGIPSASSAMTPELRNLLNETADFLDSPDFAHVLSVSLDRLFDLFTTTLEQEAFQDPPQSPSTSETFQHPLAKFQELKEKTARLVDVLPASARESKSVLLDFPNKYLEALGDVRELTELSAVVFCVHQT